MSVSIYPSSDDSFFGLKGGVGSSLVFREEVGVHSDLRLPLGSKHHGGPSLFRRGEEERRSHYSSLRSILSCKFILGLRVLYYWFYKWKVGF